MLGNEWHTGSGSYEIIAAKRERDQGEKKKKKGGNTATVCPSPGFYLKKSITFVDAATKKNLKKHLRDMPAYVGQTC